VDPPARRRSLTKHAHILGHHQGRQDIADSVHQVRPQAASLIVLNKAPEPPVAYGLDNYLAVSYGEAVHFSSFFSKYCVARAAVESTGFLVKPSLDGIKVIQGYVAAEANHTKNAKRRKQLDQLFNKLQEFLDIYNDQAE